MWVVLDVLQDTAEQHVMNDLLTLQKPPQAPAITRGGPSIKRGFGRLQEASGALAGPWGRGREKIFFSKLLLGRKIVGIIFARNELRGVNSGARKEHLA